MDNMVFIKWDNKVYYLTNNVVDSKELGEAVGQIKRWVTPEPELNGDAGSNRPDSLAIVRVGTEVYPLFKEQKSFGLAARISGDYYIFLPK